MHTLLLLTLHVHTLAISRRCAQCLRVCVCELVVSTAAAVVAAVSIEIWLLLLAH
jgi:hypothetical protein